MNASPPTTGAPRDLRRLLTYALAGALVMLAPVGAVAATGSEVGSVGSVTVEPADGLPVEGGEVVVRGTGFDPSAGIYVAVCVDNGPGEKPTPCIGGADTEGVGGATWISDDPPSYAEGLTLPYGPDGSFEVTLPVPATDDVAGVDCRVDTCAVTVRFDHLRADDRRADHVVPLSLGASDAEQGGAEEGAADEGAAEEPADQEAPAVTEEPTPAAEDDVATEATTTDDDVAAEGERPSVGVIAAVAVVALAAALALVWFVRRRRPTATATEA